MIKGQPRWRARLVFSWLLVLWAASAALAGTVTYTYDSAGRLLRADYGGGTVITYSYDAAGNLLSRQVSVGAVPDIHLSASSLEFGRVVVGTSRDLSFSVSNPGNADLTVSGLTLSGGPFSVLSPAVPFTLSAGSSQEVAVRFSPTAAGAAGATLTVVSNDPDEGSLSVSLSGEGLQPFSLSVTKTGTGSGTVTSSPAGIDCGVDCSESYANGAPVTLTATPAAGSTFAGWRDACSGAGPCTLTLDRARAATAIFTTPLTITGIGASASEGEVNVPYHVSLGISGGLPPYAISLVKGKGALPAGLSLNAGDIAGTPTRAGESSFTVQAIDDLRSLASKKVKMKIFRAVSIATKNLGKGKRGKKYGAALSATGGKKPYVWSLVSGSLPQGLSLNSATGKITGTPTESGSFNPTFQVTDALGGTASKGLSLNIN